MQSDKMVVFINYLSDDRRKLTNQLVYIAIPFLDFLIVVKGRVHTYRVRIGKDRRHGSESPIVKVVHSGCRQGAVQRHTFLKKSLIFLDQRATRNEFSLFLLLHYGLF